ncbi:hypothetical protein MMC07_001282 [Pseudocyphellaria aurata]|nr:hypothetical protein [Pseudocyphellaria aurata]
MSDHRFVVNWGMLSTVTSLTHRQGTHQKAFAYATPVNADLTPDEQLTFVDPIVKLMGMIQYVFIILMVLAFGIIKLSITFYYRRFFVTARGTLFDWITKAVVAVVVLWTIGCLLGFIFSCGIHISANWGNYQDFIAYCGPSEDVNSAFVISDLITDVMVLCLPLPVIWNLHMTMGRKLIVIAIFATGAVSIVASIVKVIISFEINNATSSTVDPDLAVSTILYWAMIEAGLAVIAACLPTLRFLVGKVSVSSILQSVRSALSLGSVSAQDQQNQSQRSPTYSKESYTPIKTGSSPSSTLNVTREKDKFSTENFVMGNVDGLSDRQEHGIQVTRQFSQHASMV